MTTAARFARFNIVGLLGIGVQLSVVALMSVAAGVDPATASVTGAGAALVHNFAWHVRWTWRDRHLRGWRLAAAFVCFVGSNGLISLAGAALLVPMLMTTTGVPAVVANVLTIAVCGGLNFVLAHATVGFFALTVRATSLAPGGNCPPTSRTAGS